MIMHFYLILDIDSSRSGSALSHLYSSAYYCVFGSDFALFLELDLQRQCRRQHPRPTDDINANLGNPLQGDIIYAMKKAKMRPVQSRWTF